MAKKSPAKAQHIPKTKLIPVTKQVRFHIVSLFPESFTSYISESIIARAQAEKRVSIFFYNPRSFVKIPKSQKGKEKPYVRVDNNPYGGGPGMVMEALPVIAAIEAAQKKATALAGKSKLVKKAKIQTIFLSPGGEQFTNEMAGSWVNDKKAPTDFIIICGRYEGVDERVNDIFKPVKISVGPFVTTGGELPAMIIMDTMARQVEGVLGNFDSREEMRASSHAVYTRPEVLEYKKKKYKVPPVLLSGDHKKIDEWRMSGKQEAKSADQA